jgi:hypothetical protein
MLLPTSLLCLLIAQGAATASSESPAIARAVDPNAQVAPQEDPKPPANPDDPGDPENPEEPEDPDDCPPCGRG